jgi:hypothetical protein
VRDFFPEIAFCRASARRSALPQLSIPVRAAIALVTARAAGIVEKQEARNLRGRRERVIVFRKASRPSEISPEDAGPAEASFGPKSARLSSSDGGDHAHGPFALDHADSHLPQITVDLYAHPPGSQ